MAQGNAAIVRATYASPDMLSLSDAVAVDVEIDFTDLYPDRPVLVGLDDLRRFREESWDGPVSFEPVGFVEIDSERVVVILRARATGRVSGTSVEARSAHQLTLRDGKVVRIRVFRDAERALRLET